MKNSVWKKYLKLIQQYKKYTKKYNKKLFLLVTTSILAKVLSLIPPFFNGRIIDNVLEKNTGNIIILLVCILLISILIGAFSLLQTYININLSNDIIIHLKSEIISKILHMQLNTFNKMSSGEYMERVENDIIEIKSFYVDVIPDLIISLISILVSGAFAFYLSPVLTIVGFISFPLSSVIYFYFGKRVKKTYVDFRKATDEYTSILQQVLNSIRAIKGLYIEKTIFKKIKYKMDLAGQLRVKNGMTSAYGGLVQLFSSTFIEILLMSLACLFIIREKITIGSYVSFNVYLGTFLSALKTVASMNLNVQTISVTLGRINQIAESKSESLEIFGEDVDAGDITIKNLYFAYDKDQNVFDNLCVDFENRRLHAVVGLSGCGKTTLFNLLLQIYQCEEQTIFFGDRDITTIALADLRKAISYVQQEPFVFSGTIKENLCIVKPEASESEIIDVCKKACIYEMIMSLPDGLDTVIGEGGFNLSGGQKQRLAIARGILKNAKLYLFDEVTSELDGEAEKGIMKAVMDLAKERNVIIIAHRLTTVINVSRIVVFDEGKMIAEGTHEKLLSCCELYRRLFKI